MGLGEDPGWGPPKGIEVDVSKLDTFAGSVEGAVESGYQPEAARLMSIYALGAEFAANTLSESVARAAVRQEECLQAAADQLVGFGSATKILVEAARDVAARYRRTDAFAAASAQEIEAALTTAKNAAAAAQVGVARAATARAAEATGLVATEGPAMPE